MRYLRALIFFAAAFLLAGPTAGQPKRGVLEITGHIELTGEDGQALPEGRESVIYFEPSGATPQMNETPTSKTPANKTPASERHEIVTVRKDFSPHVLAVQRGSVVAFPNEDPILHNVFSVSGDNRFDLGLFRGGEIRETTFEHPGLVRIFCNVHQSMAASVLVLDTPFFTQPDFSGKFLLPLVGLTASATAPLTGKLTVWHERAEPWSREIVLPLTEPLEVSLAVVRERVTPHRNKFGKPYRTRRGRDY